MTMRVYVPERRSIDALVFLDELARFTGSALVAFLVMSTAIVAVASWGSLLGYWLGVMP